MMRFGSALIAVAASACIEGNDANNCSADGACSGGRVCSRASHCELPEDLVDITARWTFAGVVPTPSRCADFDGFMVGASGPGGGFGDAFACELGSAELKRVPKTMTRIQATAYEHLGDGQYAIVDSAQVDRAGATDVTLDFHP